MQKKTADIPGQKRMQLSSQNTQYCIDVCMYMNLPYYAI